MLKDIIAFQKMLLHSKMDMGINKTVLFFIGMVMMLFLGNQLGFCILCFLIYLIHTLMYQDEQIGLLPVSAAFYVGNIFLFGIVMLTFMYIGILVVIMLFGMLVAGTAFLSGNFESGEAAGEVAEQQMLWLPIISSWFLFLTAYMHGVMSQFVFRRPMTRLLGAAFFMGIALCLYLSYLSAGDPPMWIHISCLALFLASLISCPWISTQRKLKAAKSLR